MLHRSRKIIGSTIEQHVLVHFVVARVKPAASLNSLIASFPVSEEPQVPARKITTVIDPTVQKPKPAVQVKSIQIRAANGRPDLAFQFRRYALIRIDDQHPVVPPGNIFQGPVLFSRIFLIPRELDYSRTGCDSEILRPI